ETLGRLDLKMMKAFAENAEMIITEVCGDKVVMSYATDIEKFQGEVNELRSKLVALDNEKSMLIGEIQGLHEMLVYLRTLAGEKEQATKYMEDRLNALQGDIQNTEKRMDAIPSTITVTEHHRY